MRRNKNLKRSLKKYSRQKENRIEELFGELGIPLGGTKVVDVPTRPGYVYVRLKGNTSELIQAYNSTVPSIYDYPVKVRRNRNTYVIMGKDQGKWSNTGNGDNVYVSSLPRHGGQHSLNPEFGMGADVSWIYSRQFMNQLAFPSGTSSMMLTLEPWFYEKDGVWGYSQNTGTPSFAPYVPTVTGSARMALLYLNRTTNALEIVAGGLFSGGISDRSVLAGFIPDVDRDYAMPLAAVKLTTGTTSLNWYNIYDMRDFYTVAKRWAGIGIQDEGIPVGTGSTLNFVGAGVTASVSGSVVRVSVSSGGGGTPGGSDTQLQFNDGGSFGGARLDYSEIPGSVSLTTELNGDNGEELILRGADAISDGNGGDTFLIGGVAPGNGSGGEVVAQAGDADGSGAGGSAIIKAGSSVSGSGGNVRLEAGEGATPGRIQLRNPITASNININVDDISVDRDVAFPDKDGTLALTNSVDPTLSGSVVIWDEGIHQNSARILNFVGAGITATISGSVANISVPGTTNPPVTGSIVLQNEGTTLGSITRLNIVGRLLGASISGTLGIISGTLNEQIENSITGDTLVGTEKIPMSIGDGLDYYTNPNSIWEYILNVMGTDASFNDLVENIVADGWMNTSTAAFQFVSADAPSYVISSSSNVTGTVGLGMKIKLNHLGSTKYFIVTKQNGVTGTTTWLNLYGGTDYTLTTGSITNLMFSPADTPLGFPNTPDKWSVIVTDSSDRTQTTGTVNQWYNLGSLSISIPIGAWNVGYKVLQRVQRASATLANMSTTLSTANNSESDADFTTFETVGGASGTLILLTTQNCLPKTLTLAAKTSYFLNARTTSGADSIGHRGDSGTTVIKAVCAYL